MSDPNDPKTAGRSYTAHINGGVSGQFIQGDGNVQVHTGASAKEVTQEDLAAVRALLDELRAKVDAEAPPEKKEEALAQVEELQASIESKEPDLDRMGGVKSWFKRNLPTLAGAVVSVVVNPIVGKVVEATGTGLAAEIDRRFGGGK